jgi:hypothetical protein
MGRSFLRVIPRRQWERLNHLCPELIVQFENPVRFNLGGFCPPRVMGLVYASLDDYTVGYLLLAVTAAVAALFTATVVRRRATR